MLIPCAPALSAGAQNRTKISAQWEAVASDTDVVSLLLIIRDVMYNKKERAQSTMSLMESDTVLYTTIMKGSNMLDEYYRVFKAQVDTIKAHGGNSGYQLALTQEHMEVYIVKKGFDTPKKQKSVKGNLKKMKTDTLKSSKGAYPKLFLVHICQA